MWRLYRKQWLLRIFQEVFSKCFMVQSRTRRIKGLKSQLAPSLRGGFEIVRNNFNQRFRVWKMQVTTGNKDLFKFFQKTKNSFINVYMNKVET